MGDNTPIYAFLVIIFGALTTLVPTLSTTFNIGLDLVGVLLTQIALLTVSGLLIGRIASSRANGMKFIAGGLIIVSGFLLASSLGGEPVPYMEDTHYTFDTSDELLENGTSPDTLEVVDGYLQFGDQFNTVNGTKTGTYGSDVFEGEGNIHFDQIKVGLEDFDSSVHNATLEVRAIHEGAVGDTVHTYDLSDGNNQLNVSEMNSEADLSAFEFTYTVESSEGTGNVAPRADYFDFQTTQEVTEETGQYGIIGLLVLLIYVIGGLYVVIS